MATTYELLSTINVTNGTTQTVTFSSIPQTHGDLVLRFAARSNFASSTNGQITVLVNGSACTYTGFRGTALGKQALQSGTAMVVDYAVPTDLENTGIFGDAELYFPSYTETNDSKPFRWSSALPGRNSVSYLVEAAGARGSIAAITSISLSVPATYAFISDSNFYLYGIKHA